MRERKNRLKREFEPDNICRTRSPHESSAAINRSTRSFRQVGQPRSRDKNRLSISISRSKKKRTRINGDVSNVASENTSTRIIRTGGRRIQVRKKHRRDVERLDG